MKISLNWLKEFVDVAETPQQLRTRLTGVGLAVDALDQADDDFIYELDIATNRPDCLGHVGVAREVAAIYGTALRMPKFELRETHKRTAEVFGISIEDPDLCGRYCGRYVKGVKIGPSPDWLKNRLEALGVRSINNVADLTNYVMLELSQPLHAFDANTLANRQIIVRRARSGERMTTLDGIERNLDSSMLMIADAERSIAVAGVMGGAETEISPTTTGVLLESANFNPLSIRKTSRALGLSTEASYRFERGADITMASFACDRAAALIQGFAGGQIYRDVIDVYPGRKHAGVTKLRRQRIQSFLGAPVDDAIVEGIFQRLGFRCTATSEGWSVEIPPHRVDIALEEDLLDEIARHHGFDKFPATLPSYAGFGAGLPLEAEERLLRNRIAAQGYSEVNTMAFSDEPTERRFRPDIGPVKLVNPMAEDEAILRTSLLPSMLRTLQWNLNRGIRDLQLYEFGKVYMKGPEEERWLILAATGSLRSKSVHESERPFNFHDLKGDVEDVLQTFDVDLTISSDHPPAYYHPGRFARIGDIAFLGELHPEYAEWFKLRQRVYLAELDLPVILSSRQSHQLEPIPRFPSVRRDLSLLVNKGVTYSEVLAEIPRYKELTKIEPFDRVESGPFAESKYSLAISLWYQSNERTLTDAEVDELHTAVLGHLALKDIHQRK
jgi:phenylalanyl-tRNA synthetase beta chain